MYSRGVKRIHDVQLLKTIQFSEDASPTSHPVKPSSYVEINNFYFQKFFLWADRSWVLDPPPSGQPTWIGQKVAEKISNRISNLESRIFAQTVVICHPEEQFYQVW